VVADWPVAALPVRVDHRVIVAIGDSYGSGEGNPDVPTRWKTGAAPVGSYDWLEDPGKKGSLIDTGARWWDTPCHRSFWSHQTYVAMRLASESQHRLVTYLHYSCSAAQVFDGMMVRQIKPPGRDDCSGRGCGVPTSQLAAVVRDLCAGTAEDSTAAIADITESVRKTAKAKDRKLFLMGTYDEIGLDLADCEGDYREPDLMLVSIGGNDVGFGSLAGWAVLPVEARNPLAKWLGLFRLFRGLIVTCPAHARQSRWGCREPYDTHLINQLERRYRLLGRAIRDLVRINPENVVVTSYPDPLHNRKNEICYDPVDGKDRSPWAGGYTRVPFCKKGWDFNIVEGEALQLGKYTLPLLRAAIEDAAKREGFASASATGDAFVGHCWREADEGDWTMALPSAAQSEWKCTGQEAGAPACWQPFAPRRRFIRTINDSLLTQSSARDDDMTGAVHPTAQGHAAVADAMMTTVMTTPAFAESAK
jgi:hypothetical protein